VGETPEAAMSGSLHGAYPTESICVKQLKQTASS